MWLINCQTLELEEFLQDVPSYAILSHTWGDEEATFGYDLRAGAGKAGAQKIQAACRTALAAGLRYCWVDTICIDKKSSAELSEAINSMFAWYRGSQVCYVHLVDFTLRDHASGTVTPGTPAPPSFKDAIAKCRWITRGWTLQELIAPANVEFYDRLWQPIGDKSSLRDMLSEITGIENPVLSGAKPCEDVLVGRRMSWAAARTTTRREDMAYCLLGIFGVNMPLIYGEGDRAFLRLQEEIMKQSNDLSILSWKALEPRPRFRGLSPSPSSVTFKLCALQRDGTSYP
ncbi:heterokaryon incompatibility protein-domain-containing protein [Xylariales sp. PMI_506]|nr:heterokaryon incompatibility protein-domain-containing protein [Xylariales sp. PMI_506]